MCFGALSGPLGLGTLYVHPGSRRALTATVRTRSPTLSRVTGLKSRNVASRAGSLNLPRGYGVPTATVVLHGRPGNRARRTMSLVERTFEPMRLVGAMCLRPFVVGGFLLYLIKQKKPRN